MEDFQDNASILPERSRTDEIAPTPVGPLQAEESALPKRRLGGLKGLYAVPDDIKTMFAEEIEEMFYGNRAQHKFDDIEEILAERFRQEAEAKS